MMVSESGSPSITTGLEVAYRTVGIVGGGDAAHQADGHQKTLEFVLGEHSPGGR